MAFSKSIEKEILTVCQYCEESAGILWNCINCQAILCQPCRYKIHGKNKSFANHTIINLKELGTEDSIEKIRKVDLQRIPCTIHNDQKCCVFCANCQLPICSCCLIKSHQNHTFSELSEAYETKISEMRNLKVKVDSDMPYFQNEESRLRQVLSEAEKEHQQTRERIVQHERDLKQAVEKYAQELLEEHEKQWKPFENKVKEELSIVKEMKDDLETRQHILEKILNSQQVSDIFTTVDSLKNTVNRRSSSLHVKQMRTKFIPGSILREPRNITFGDIYTIPDLELVQTYETDLQSVSTILFGANNTAYISSYKSETVEKVKFENDKIKIQNKTITDVYDMAMLHTGDVLISSGGNDLKLYGKVKPFKSFTQLETLGIHVNKDIIIVGLTEPKNVNLPTKDRKSRVVVMNLEGKIQQSFENDKDNQRLFTLPVRISSFDDNICIVDTFNLKDEGRIVVVDKGGQLQWVYRGWENNNSNKGEFCPEDIAVTDFILISDYRNRAIHLLNYQGEVITCIGVKDLGIEIPFGMNIDKAGRLWVGCTVLEHGKSNARLHCVKLT